MAEIRVALVGIGNAASGFVQYLEFLKQLDNRNASHSIGGYDPDDIKFVAAFDVNETKVGRDLSEAIFAEPNSCPMIINVEPLDVVVQRGPTLDGIGPTTQGIIKESTGPVVDVIEVIHEARADVIINLTPTGSDKLSEFWAETALKTDCALIQGSPTPIASNNIWARKFRKAVLPVVGDDLQSQLGGTRIHRGLLELLVNYGARIKSTYQLDVSGGTEGLNTLDYQRRMSKRSIKTESIRRVVPYLGKNDVASGTTDYLEFLGNQRFSYFWIDARYFNNTPLQIDMTLKSYDGPNAARTLYEATCAVKIALDRGIGGPVLSVCAYAFKSSPVITTIFEAKRWFDEFIEGRRPR